MKKLFPLLLIALLAFSTIAAAADNVSAIFGNKTASSSSELAKNWMLLAIGALILSVILVAIAYAIGIGFEMTDLQAWAGNELVQIITNAIIIGALVACIAFIELVVISIAFSSNLNIAECSGGSSSSGASCLQAATDHYLNNYVTTAKEKSKAVLKNSVDTGGWMGRRLGITCISIYCLQLSVSGTFKAQDVLKLDKYGIMFEYYTNLLSFMESQLFFVRAISFNIAPVVLAIGIVMRSFFFSRKLGGLLMAIAIGVMFFFPGMYIFDWLTLDFAANGDKAYDDELVSCPAECLVAAPLAYFKDGGQVVPFNSTADVYFAFNSTDVFLAQGILNGSLASRTATTQNTSYFAYGKEIQSCYPSTPGSKAGPDIKGHYASECPTMCRELPYPSTSECVNKTLGTAYACAAVPEECKVKRIVQDQNQTLIDACPMACKVVPPLRSNCYVKATDKNKTGGDCIDSSYDCRLTLTNDTNWRPAKSDTKNNDVAKNCAKAKDCVASLDANLSCVYVVPPTGLCDDMCAGCPSVCRIDAFWNGTVPQSQLKEPCNDSGVITQCKKCHPGCMMRKGDIDSLSAKAAAAGNCTQCPWQNRVTQGSDMPPAYTNGFCSYEQCAMDYRAFVPRNVCDMCLIDDEQYLYNPPTNPRCSDMCKPPDNAPVSQPGVNLGGDGLAGDIDIQDLSRLMIPVYVLPLFNIVATLVFIKGLSTFLGGDIEIPGLTKVF